MDNVMMECSCGLVLSINKLYFCQYCVTFRCRTCSQKEILSIHCDHCFEKASKNVALFVESKCLNCFDCPFCSNHLTLRRRNKSFYLLCSFCLWLQNSEPPNQLNYAQFARTSANERVSQMMELYDTRIIQSLKEFSHRNLFITTSAKFDFTLNLQTPRLRSSTLSLLVSHLQDKSLCVKPSIAEENKDSLPISIFNSSVDLSKITSVNQRHADPTVQASSLDELRPVRRLLKAESILLCRECSHNLKFPDSESSNYFKVNRNCFFYVPKLKVVKCEPLRYDSISELVLEVFNCFPHNVSVHFFQNLESCNFPKNLLDTVSLPKIPILLPPKYSSSHCDGVRVRFLIQPNILTSDESDAIVSFRMQYSYLNKVLTTPELARLNCKIFIKLGKLTDA